MKEDRYKKDYLDYIKFTDVKSRQQSEIYICRSYVYVSVKNAR